MRDEDKTKEQLIGELAQLRRRVTELEASEEALHQIEWLLTKSIRHETVEERQEKGNDQSYGDLTTLNTDRMLLDSVGKNVLTDIAKDFLDLLDSSSAIYEKNGDYALGIFTSGWCRFLDQASRNLCRTDDNQEALASGRWHCHESCWDASKTAMKTDRPVDIDCLGGIRLYAVPIWAGEEVVGAINFGYGTPLKDPQTLQEIAARYSVDQDELLKQAEAYEIRPSFIIETAKIRLQAAARLIGEIVERKLTEEALQKLNAELEQRVAERTAELRKIVSAMAGREVRMAELKGVIKQLRAQLQEAGMEPVADDPLFAE